MEIARQPYPMQRTYTAPVDAAPFNPLHNTAKRPAHMSTGPPHNSSSSSSSGSLATSQAHTSSTHSIASQQSNRSSDTTQGTSQSTLFSTNPSPAPNQYASVGSEVTATDNVMNSVADASSSLFQICVTLRQRLQAVPGFAQALAEEEEDADEDTDPVTLLWRTFRRGEPLLVVLNELLPHAPIEVGQTVKEDKRAKAATFKFLNGCIRDLNFPSGDCFILSDLYGDDTTGFVKVARLVNRLLDLLVQRGVIEDIRPTASDFKQAAKGMKRTQRQHIVSELVTTERTYVQHLELLQSFKLRVEERGVIPGDSAHDIFLNLNALLDFQRRFLIRVEQTNALPEEEQNWGKLFCLYSDAFKVYEPYIANQRNCEKMVVAEFPKLRDAGGTVEMRQMVESPTSLYGFLMKPFQRLSKYPLLLDDLYKRGDLDEGRKADLMIGKTAATDVLTRADRAVDREEKVKAVLELRSRVEDWKQHDANTFGELLLYGTFTVVKSENSGPGKDGERQYHVYLFDTILLCCKDIDLSKPKNKLSNKQLVDKRGKPKLQLKGRIFMQNVTDLVSLTKPGSYTCQIFWKGDPSIENFIIRFTTEEMMKKWAHQIQTQQQKHQNRSRQSTASNRYGTSTTEFEFMRNQPALENPHARYPVEEDDEDGSIDSPAIGSYSHHRDLSQSRNGSQTSLRSRSTTADSSSTGHTSAASRVHPRLPSGVIAAAQPQLSLRTRDAVLPSPGAQPYLESYFSPTGESPLSSSVRTSTSSTNTYNFPRPQMGEGGYYEEGYGNTRFTAPAVARQRLPSGTPEDYVPGVRGPDRIVSGMHSAQQMPGGSRSRSASTPNIHNALKGSAGAHRGQPGMDQPPVPDVPAPYMHNPHMAPRSQSNSPNLVAGVRVPTQSPQSQRERERVYAQAHQQNPRPPVMHDPDGSPSDLRTSGMNPYPPHHQHPVYQTQDPYSTSRTSTPVLAQQTLSPPLPQDNFPSPSSSTSRPTQLKVKVHCPSASQTLTLVVPLNISYTSLRDRIDAKLQRSTNLSLSESRGPNDGQVKLKYLDETDMVSIQSDEDVLTAFETWAEQRGQDVMGMGEIELFCQR